MAAGGKKGALAKLRKELQRIGQEPPENIQVSVNERDLLEWHYLLRGPSGTPYDGGWYWGKLKFPPEYPFKPPGIIMHTPSGRFETNMRLCLSMSDYHPETWNPMWSVASVLTGLLSFMTGSDITTGSIETTEEEKKRLAAKSMSWNLSSPIFIKLFPHAETTAQRVARGEKVKVSGVALTADEEEEEEEEKAEGEEKKTETEEENKAKGEEKKTETEEEDKEDKEQAGEGGEQETAQRNGQRAKKAEAGGESGEEVKCEGAGGGGAARQSKSEEGAEKEERAQGQDAGEGGLTVGDEVVITNLVKQAHLNGIRCIVKEVAPDGKCKVKPLEGGLKAMLLKTQNLTLDDDDDDNDDDDDDDDDESQ